MPTLLDRQNRISAGITGVDEQIALLTTEIDAITTALGATGLSADFITEMTTYQTTLTNQKTGQESRKTRLQNRLATVQTQIVNDTVGFTGTDQTTADAIDTLFSSQYATQMADLKCRDAGEKADFFTLYDQATNDTMRELVIKSYFRVG